MKTHKFRPLVLAQEGDAGAVIRVRCIVTGVALPWNEAVRAGWVADLNGEPFKAYYSPAGKLQTERKP